MNLNLFLLLVFASFPFLLKAEPCAEFKVVRAELQEEAIRVTYLLRNLCDEPIWLWGEVECDDLADTLSKDAIRVEPWLLSIRIPVELDWIEVYRREPKSGHPSGRLFGLLPPDAGLVANADGSVVREVLAECFYVSARYPVADPSSFDMIKDRGTFLKMSFLVYRYDRQTGRLKREVVEGDPFSFFNKRKREDG